MRFLLLIVLLGGSAGCVVTARPIPPHGPMPPPPPAAPPSSPRPITREDANRIALNVAANRGHRDLRIDEVEREDGRWEVEVRGRFNGRRSEVRVSVGRYGEVLKVREKKGGGDDDDSDDDD